MNTNSLISQENIEKVRKMYHERCIRCGKSSRIVHELVPKSKRPKDWWEIDNMVVLCPECHNWAHNIGTTNSKEILVFSAQRRLRQYANSG